MRRSVATKRSTFAISAALIIAALLSLLAVVRADGQFDAMLERISVDASPSPAPRAAALSTPAPGAATLARAPLAKPTSGAIDQHAACSGKSCAAAPKHDPGDPGQSDSRDNEANWP